MLTTHIVQGRFTQKTEVTCPTKTLTTTYKTTQHHNQENIKSKSNSFPWVQSVTSAFGCEHCQKLDNFYFKPSNTKFHLNLFTSFVHTSLWSGWIEITSPF